MKDWDIVDDKLTKEFVFKNFAEAIRFINSIADIAEARDHHPDIYLHSYKKVKITLRTHNVMAITEKDYNLANAIDNIGKQWYI
jgi:4a-hydroxytetrahydrobiopterin dehydratase